MGLRKDGNLVVGVMSPDEILATLDSGGFEQYAHAQQAFFHLFNQITPQGTFVPEEWQAGIEGMAVAAMNRYVKDVVANPSGDQRWGTFAEEYADWRNYEPFALPEGYSYEFDASKVLGTGTYTYSHLSPLFGEGDTRKIDDDDPTKTDDDSTYEYDEGDLDLRGLFGFSTDPEAALEREILKTRDLRGRGDLFGEFLAGSRGYESLNPRYQRIAEARFNPASAQYMLDLARSAATYGGIGGPGEQAGAAPPGTFTQFIRAAMPGGEGQPIGRISPFATGQTGIPWGAQDALAALNPIRNIYGLPAFGAGTEGRTREQQAIFDMLKDDEYAQQNIIAQVMSAGVNPVLAQFIPGMVGRQSDVLRGRGLTGDLLSAFLDQPGSFTGAGTGASLWGRG